MKRSILAIVLTLTLLLALAACNTHSHEFLGEWLSDETGHWQVCSCGEASEKVAHTGGTATETEKALCEVCGQSYGELAVHVHNYNAVVTAPTCQAGGYTTYTCACGDSYVGDETAKADHSYEAVVTAPTCQAGGYTTYTCACGDSYVSDENAKADHSYEAVVTAPTCTEAGYTTYTCGCGDSYVSDETTAVGHNMVNTKDDTHHWTECDREGCDEATEKVAHSADSIKGHVTNMNLMQYETVTAEDIEIKAQCACGKSYFAPASDIVIENAYLNCVGGNEITVKVGNASLTMHVNATKFNVVVNGSVADDTYVYSGNGYKDRVYADAAELSANGNGQFRVLLRYNFNDVIANKFYQDHKDEAKIQFTFTMTTGEIDDTVAITFKAYPVNETISNVDFGILCWTNYDATYGLGWGKADGFVSKEAGSPLVSIVDGKITISLTYREIEEYIDENGNAVFVFAIWKNGTKVGSTENETEANRPTVSVIFNDDHVHAYIEEVVDEKYLASANCGETAKYYKSCSCGEASTATFDYGEVIEHSYGEFVETQAPTCTVEGVNTKTCGKCGDTQTEAIPVIKHSYSSVVTNPTCTEAGYTTYTCTCGDTYTDDEVSATGHTYGEWLYDESYHWQACACGDIANKTTHAGGEATETEKAVCDTCKQPYGGFASHVHNYNEEVTYPTCTTDGFTKYTCDCGDVYTGNVVTATGHTYGEWESFSPATCDKDEVLIHYCDCGVSETSKGAAAFGHDMQTKFDENNHWTECAHNCGASTEAVAHFGGEATETEQAICEGCNQPYGELKEAPKQEYVINGAIVEDTYVNTSTSYRDSNYSDKNFVATYKDNARAYFKFDFSNIINSEDFDENDPNAKIQFVFAACKNPNNSYKYIPFDETIGVTFAGFAPGEGTTGVGFNTLSYNSIGELHWTNGTGLGTLLSGNTVSQKPNNISVSEDGATLTLTFTYAEIKSFIGEDGLAVFTFRSSNIKPCIATMENTAYAIPEVRYIYEK